MGRPQDRTPHRGHRGRRLSDARTLHGTCRAHLTKAALAALFVPPMHRDTKKAPSVPGLLASTEETSIGRTLDASILSQRTHQSRRGSRGSTPHISPQTSHRLDNRNYTGGGKESDEKEVTLCRRKTTTKRSQRPRALPAPPVGPSTGYFSSRLI